MNPALKKKGLPKHVEEYIEVNGFKIVFHDWCPMHLVLIDAGDKHGAIDLETGEGFLTDKLLIDFNFAPKLSRDSEDLRKLLEGTRFKFLSI